MLYETVKITDSSYPKLLKEIQNPPSPLYIKGTLPKTQKVIAIVGTRKASEKGTQIAYDMAKTLSQEGYVIVSGLALGIDTASHKGALDGRGETVAVLGNSIDTIYPDKNKSLANKIIEANGAVISEYGPGEKTEKQNFLQRNRIISGLSIATVVIEAPARSGALATARLAGEQGRDVFVIPGSIDNLNYEGSNTLIRDGALLVRSAEDVLEIVSHQSALFEE